LPESDSAMYQLCCGNFVVEDLTGSYSRWLPLFRRPSTS
jgi:hypothetical protein